jgi:hypothetical protein
MASQSREFTLVGKFSDGITPELKKLNTQLNSLTKSFDKMAGKLRPISKELGIMAGATRTLTENFKTQRGAYESNMRAMKQYRSEVGKVVASQKQLQKKVSLPGISGGGRGPGGNGGGRVNRGGSIAADVVSGGVITAAIVKGFDIGVQIMQRGFAYISQTFAERIGDQIEDIAGAGGIFAGAKSAGLKEFGSTMDDAMDVQKELNRSMATLAADLPGTTNDFVRNARSITDTMMTAMAKSPGQFVKAMEGMTGKTGLDQKGALIAATTSVAQSTTMLEKLAPGGGMPMTMLFEDLMSRDTVDAKNMQRKYASMRRNPTLIAALERNQKEINKYAAGSGERLVAISKALNEAVPPEMVNMMKRSVSGVIEGFKSNFLDPDTGLFGLSRQMGFVVTQFDTTTGKARLNKAGKVVKEAVGIFELISDIFGNLGVVLNSSLVPALVNLIYPFDQLGQSLVKFREWTFKVFERFQLLTKYFTQVGKTYGLDASTFQATTRGGLATVASIFQGLGELSSGQYAGIIAQLKSKDPKAIKNVGSQLLEIFKESKFLNTITELVGSVVGGALDALADMLDMVLSGTEKFAAKGFGKGFAESGGYQAITRIFANIFKLLWKGFTEAVKLWFASMGQNLFSGNFGAVLGQVGITALLVPPLRSFLMSLFEGIFSTGTAKGVAGRAMRGGGIFATLSGGRTKNRLRGVRAGAGQALAPLGPVAMTMAGMKPGRALIRQRGLLGGAARGAARMGRFIPGGALAMGAIDAASGMMQGESPGVAIGKAAVTTITSSLGAALGTVIAPGIGTAIGGVAGAMIGDAVSGSLVSVFSGPSDAQMKAAKAQMFAAEAMKAALPVSGKQVGPAADFAGTGIIGISQLNKAFKYAGLGGDKAAQDYISAASNMASIRAQLDELKAKAEKQKALSGGRVDTQLQGKIEATTKTLVVAEKQAAAAWDKISKTNKDKINNAIVQMQTNFTAFNSALITQSGRVQKALEEATAKINAAKLTPEAVARLNSLFSGAGVTPKPTPKVKGSNWKGGLGDALRDEMKHKPSGSKLVIANSSETIIPASKGLNTQGMAKLLRNGSGGGNYSVVNHISIQQTAGQDAEELASIVALKISNAVSELRSASYYV